MIVEMARAMMLRAKLPQLYWADAVKCTCYVRNRCPSRVLNNMTPYEAVMKVWPDSKHLRVVGCKVQVLAPKENRQEFNPKA